MEDCDLLTLDEMSSLAPTKELTSFEFKIARSHVGDIVNKKRWSHC